MKLEDIKKIGVAGGGTMGAPPARIELATSRLTAVYPLKSAFQEHPVVAAIGRSRISV